MAQPAGKQRHLIQTREPDGNNIILIHQGEKKKAYFQGVCGLDIRKGNTIKLNNNVGNSN